MQMKAFVHTKYGPPDVLELKVVPDPVPGDNEILIKVHAATVNRTDDGLLRASPFIARFFTGLFRPKNNISGSEFSGRVEATGIAIITPLFGGRKVLFPIPSIDREMIHYLRDLADSGKFKPVIDRIYNFEEIPKAFQYVNAGQKTGNIVISYGNNVNT